MTTGKTIALTRWTFVGKVMSDKDPYSQSYVFPVVIYGCESWIIKKAEHQRIDAFNQCFQSVVLNKTALVPVDIRNLVPER